MIESIGKRIAFLRQKNGWTQQSLANRLAMSRVAISHIEMDLTIPSERSITLMAGVFKLSPLELVDGTTYPKAKAERLPGLTATITEIELSYELLKNDQVWLQRLDHNSDRSTFRCEIVDGWSVRIDELASCTYDEHDINILLKMRQIVKEISNH